MADEQIIYISPEEELNNVRERVEGTAARRIILVIPPQTQLRSHVGWRLLHARARELSKDVVIISSDRQIKALAKAVGFRVADSLESPSTNKSRPPSRPGRNLGGGKTPPGSRSNLVGNLPPSLYEDEEGDGEDEDTLMPPEQPIRPGPPAIHPLSSQFEDEEPDLLIEDFQKGQFIRFMASQSPQPLPMADTLGQGIKLFYCYAREDKSLRDELEKHLSWLKRRYSLTNWHDREILPGEEWEQAIDKHLNSAHLILLLISPDFMASDYCFGKEMQRALERHKTGTCRVVPVLLRPTYWEDAPFSSLQLLPTDARPITRWSDRDEAFQNVVTEISRTIKDLLILLKTKEDLFNEAQAHYNLNRYKEALVFHEQAIGLDPNFVEAYINKGLTLYRLNRCEEALTAYEQAIRLNPNIAEAYINKSFALNHLNRHDEAVQAYTKAGQLGSES